MPCRIDFAASVKGQLRVLTTRERARVLGAIERQLGTEPLHEARNRKPLRPNPIAPWELRVGALRVFYEVDPGTPQTVHVLAVGKKTKNVLRIGGKEVRL